MSIRDFHSKLTTAAGTEPIFAALRKIASIESPEHLRESLFPGGEKGYKGSLEGATDVPEEALVR
jgi:hypothetical protein